MARRIDPIHARAHHGQRRAPGLNCAPMTGRVDALSQAAGDDQACTGQVLGKIEGRLGPTGGRVPAAHHGKLGTGEEIRLTMHEEQQRWIAGFCQ